MSRESQLEQHISQRAEEPAAQPANALGAAFRGVQSKLATHEVGLERLQEPLKGERHEVDRLQQKEALREDQIQARQGYETWPSVSVEDIPQGVTIESASWPTPHQETRGRGEKSCAGADPLLSEGRASGPSRAAVGHLVAAVLGFRRGQRSAMGEDRPVREAAAVLHRTWAFSAPGSIAATSHVSLAVGRQRPTRSRL